MVHHSTKDGDASIRPVSGSEPGVRKFTLSCSRCRASKLRCDKNAPCIECVKRNVGHLCTKDERQPRAKRTKTDPSNKNKPKIDASQHQDTEAEDAAQALEQFVDGASRTNAYPSATLEPTLAFVAPDYANRYWSTTDNPQRQGEKLALIREIVEAMPEPDMIRPLYDVFTIRCPGPLGNVVHTTTFLTQAEKLYGCLGLASPEAQVMALSTLFPMDTLACYLLALMLSLAFHPTPAQLGWFPTPLTLGVEELRASDVHSRTWRSLALRCLQGGVSLFAGSIASLQAAIMLLLDGQEESLVLDAILVTAISGAQKLGLHQLGEARLDASASPTPSSEDGLSVSTEPPHMRTEIGIRIWWALVMRDWSRGQALGYYNIRPSHFNTRMPLHINDDDLCPASLNIDVHAHITERPRSEFTMLSYTVHALEVAGFARESIDLRGPLRRARPQEETNEVAKMRNHLNKKYENFVAGLPSYFRLGSIVGLTSTGPMAAIPVKRWMLHQQLWSLFLRLHRASLWSRDGRASCQLLAQNIISNHVQLQGRCAVCSSLSFGQTQLFNAAVVLLVDLLFSSKHKEADCSVTQLSRLMTRDKIREAIELLQTRSDAKSSPFLQDHQSERLEASAQRSVIALEALMKLEEEEASSNEERNGANSTGSRSAGQRVQFDGSARKTLKTKVMDILEAIQRNANDATAAMEQADLNSFSTQGVSMPLSTVPDVIQDLDVLPLLSNDPSSNFWQFLDFAAPPPPSSAENGYFPTTADFPTLVGSTPLRPTSGVAHSLSGFGTPEFADVYSTTDGTCVTHTPLSSIESGPTRFSGDSEAATAPSSTDAYGAAKMF